jgi:hypothetical protein
MEAIIAFAAVSLSACGFLIYVCFNFHRELMFLAKTSAAGSRLACAERSEAAPTPRPEHQAIQPLPVRRRRQVAMCDARREKFS